MSAYDEWEWERARARYRVAMAINLRPPRDEKPWQFLNALSRAYRRVRREVWTERTAAGHYTLGRPALTERGENWMVS